MKSLCGPIGIVAHDAGGAGLLAAFVKENIGDYLFALEGPAVKVFKGKIADVEVLTLKEVLSFANTVITGTGWQTNFEWDAIRLATLMGKKVVTLLDNWSNYESRFVRNSTEALPNEIWVADERALSIAKQTFSRVPVKLIALPNLRSEMLEKYEEFSQNGQDDWRGSVLFLSDNIAEATKSQGFNPGYTDFESLQFLIENLDSIKGATFPVTVRPHPSEGHREWEAIARTSGGKIIISRTADLLEDFAKHEFVVGSNSSALTMSVACGKLTFSALREPEGIFSVPANGVLFLSNLK